MGQEALGGLAFAAGAAAVVEGQRGHGTAAPGPRHEDGTVEATAEEDEGRGAFHTMSLRFIALMLRPPHAAAMKASHRKR